MTTEFVLGSAQVDVDGNEFHSPRGKSAPKYYTGCWTCEDYKKRYVTFFPAHMPSSGCKSGKGLHCTCDACF